MNEEANSKVEGLKPTIPLITLNVNGLNIPVERQSLSDWMRKPRLNCRLLPREQVKYQNTKRLKVKDRERHSVKF